MHKMKNKDIINPSETANNDISDMKSFSLNINI
jgi:hypothetical protein